VGFGVGVGVGPNPNPNPNPNPQPLYNTIKFLILSKYYINF